MKMFYKAAVAATLLTSATTLIEFHSHAQTPDYLGLGEAELSAGDLDLARRDLTQAFQIAKQNGDVGTLLRLTNDLKVLLEKAAPPPYYVSGYEADVGGAFGTALDAAIHEACYDPSSPGSGTNVSGGQADLRAIIGLYMGLFGTPDTSASGLKGRLSYTALAAESYLNDSVSGAPSCQPAPPPAPAPAPAPSPTNTSGGSPTPAPTNTSGPAPTNTSGPAPTNTSGAALTAAPTSG